MFEDVLARLGDTSTHLYFHVLGEPLLHPELDKLLDIAHKRKKLVNLVTNGTLIRTAGDMLGSKPALRQVTFSMHSLPAGSTASAAQDYFYPVLEFTRKARHDHFVCFRFWPQNESENVAARTELLAQIEKAFGQTYSLCEKLKTTSAIQLDKNVFLNQSRRFDWPDMTGPDFGESGFCLGLREQIAVLVDGTVVPCCLDRNADMALGNVFKQPIEEILGSERAMRIVEGFSKRRVVEELCRKCGYRKRFD
jgi:radical SAM protein with 4Fe4S-binding SPASM domain